MTIAYFVLAVLCGLLFDAAWVALLFRMRRVGTFKVLRETGAMFGFVSSTGTFVASREAGSLTVVQGKSRATLKFSEIKGLEYRVNEKYALLEEFFFGLDLTDLLARYQDTVEWFSIALITQDGKRIPLYLSGQYQQREFLMGWYIEHQARVLAHLGFITNVEDQSRNALRLIQANFGNPRLL